MVIADIISRVGSPRNPLKGYVGTVDPGGLAGRSLATASSCHKSCCHPERSEGPDFLRCTRQQVLRFAQDDNMIGNDAMSYRTNLWGTRLGRSRSWVRLRLENESVAQQKIHQRTNDNRNQIGHDIVDLQFPHEQPHQHEVPSQRYRSITEVELRQPEQRLQPPRSWTVCPGEALVPQEIVDDGNLDRQPCSQQI